MDRLVLTEGEYISLQARKSRKQSHRLSKGFAKSELHLAFRLSHQRAMKVSTQLLFSSLAFFCLEVLQGQSIAGFQNELTIHSDGVLLKGKTSRIFLQCLSYYLYPDCLGSESVNYSKDQLMLTSYWVCCILQQQIQLSQLYVSYKMEIIHWQETKNCIY